jgi:hypothetical protein
MRSNPVRQLLRPGEFRKDAAGYTERCDEQLGFADFAGVRIDNAELRARVVDEQLLAGRERLAQRDRQRCRPAFVVLTKPAVAVAFRFTHLVLVPEQIERHVLATQFAVDLHPLRHRPFLLR